MTKAVYEWCTLAGKYTLKQPTMVNGVRKRRGTGSKRPKVRCPTCGRRLTVKARDQEPQGAYEPYWVIPRHKFRVK